MRFGWRLIKLLLAILLAVVPGFSQSADELQQKYQSLDATHFIARPHIVITVVFSGDGHAQHITITHQESSASDKFFAKLLPSSTVTELIDELAPANRRGQLINEITFSSGCVSVHATHYERVMISRITTCTSEGSGESSAEVRWKTTRQ